MSWRGQPRDSRGRWTKTGGGLVAIALALVVGAGGAGSTAGATGGAAAGGGTNAGRSVGGQGSGARVRARAKSTTRVVQRLRARGLRVDERAVDADDDCAAHSYGQVHEFLVQHPCSALYRGLFEVRDGRVSAIVALAWVDMPTEDAARELQQLVDRHETGNLTELTKEGGAPRSVEWTGEHYTSTRDDVTFVNAQAEPVEPTASAVRLAELTVSTAVS